ncbi:Uteroglobin [Bienertia sinuspersici]
MNSDGTGVSNQNSTKESSVSDAKKDTGLQSSDILEKARAAIASAEHASAAARAAAQLVNVKFGSSNLEGKS